MEDLFDFFKIFLRWVSMVLLLKGYMKGDKDGNPDFAVMKVHPFKAGMIPPIEQNLRR